jgi:hypothetical protein
MGASEWIYLLQKKSSPPTWQFEGPFSDLTSTFAGSSGKDWNQKLWFDLYFKMEEKEKKNTHFQV